MFQFIKQQTYDYVSGASGGQFYNQRADMSGAWQSPGDNASYQQYTTGANGTLVSAYFNYAASDATVVDGSYIRLKNISLSYDLPKESIKGLQCRLFLQGQNLLTFTSYKGGDPEFKYTGYLPPLKMYTAGIQLNF